MGAFPEGMFQMVYLAIIMLVIVSVTLIQNRRHRKPNLEFVGGIDRYERQRDVLAKLHEHPPAA